MEGEKRRREDTQNSSARWHQKNKRRRSPSSFFLVFLTKATNLHGCRLRPRGASPTVRIGEKQSSSREAERLEGAHFVFFPTAKPNRALRRRRLFFLTPASLSLSHPPPKTKPAPPSRPSSSRPRPPPRPTSNPLAPSARTSLTPAVTSASCCATGRTPTSTRLPTFAASPRVARRWRPRRAGPGLSSRS